MLPSFIITFRETLEAALVVGIVLSYLARTKQTRFNRIVYSGVAFGVFVSVFAAVLFMRLAGGLTGRAEEIFEGVTMLLGAVLLTTMILWMLGQRHVAQELESRVAGEVAQARGLALFWLVAVGVLREGIETVIFLGAASFASPSNNLLGALSGIAAAILLGYAMFAGTRRVNLKVFFNVSSILLILFAAGLVARGVHALQEANLLPTAVEHVWDLNPAVNADGSYPLLHEDGYLGGLFKSLFGYNGDPSLIEVVSYVAYLVVVFVVWRLRTGRSTHSSSQSVTHNMAAGTTQIPH